MNRRAVLSLVLYNVNGIFADLDIFCPVCEMITYEESTQESLHFYIQFANGQQIHTCSMEDVHLHPVEIAFNMSVYIDYANGCKNECLECAEKEILDPMSRHRVTADNVHSLCIIHGQQLQFASLATKDAYMKHVINIPYLLVNAMFCGKEQHCEESFAWTGKTPTMSHSSGNGIGNVLGDQGDITDSGAFCTGASAMVNGFQSSFGGRCALLLFQPFALNTAAKYLLGLVAVFFLALGNEYFVRFREKVRVHSAEKVVAAQLAASDGSPKSIARMKLHRKLMLSVLYMIQMTVAYWLMLVAMTYETGLFIMLIFGFGAGFLLFKSFDEKVDSLTTHLRKQTSGRLPEAMYPSDGILLDIDGMFCMKNCGNTVKGALLNVNGVVSVNILFTERKAHVTGLPVVEELIEAVEAVGFGATLSSASTSST